MATTAYMIKQFGVLSVAKFCALTGLIWGFVMGLMMVVGTVAMDSLGLGFGLGGIEGSGVSAGLLGFLMIIIGGIGGFIGGAILAFIYNIVLGIIGGIEMDLEVKT